MCMGLQKEFQSGIHSYYVKMTNNKKQQEFFYKFALELCMKAGSLILNESNQTLLWDSDSLSLLFFFGGGGVEFGFSFDSCASGDTQKKILKFSRSYVYKIIFLQYFNHKYAKSLYQMV